MHEHLKSALAAMKTALVKSYVGAIALGYLFAQGVLYFIGIFIDPVTRWLTERQALKTYSNFTSSKPPDFPFQVAISELVYCVFSLLIAYGLLRWLYYPPRKAKKKVRRRSRNLWARVR
jgi:hypothetical protein